MVYEQKIELTYIFFLIQIIDIDKVVCGISDIGDENLNGRIIWKLTNLDLCPIIDIGLVITVSLCVLLCKNFILYI